MIRLLLTLAFVGCFSLATKLAPAFDAVKARGGSADSPLLALLGDTRRLFANQLFSMADVYFHSGYYPTIFDRRKTEGPSHLDVATHQEDTPGQGAKDDDDDNFMGKPRDAFEAFGRNFFPTNHTHLESQNAREILPWLKLSAQLDPNRIDTYVTASYWLRTHLNRYDEAEAFLRDGLRANPDSHEILLELALKKWREQDKAGLKPDPNVQDEILGELVRYDEQSGDLHQLLADLEDLARVAPNKGSVEQYIEQVKARLNGQK
jgi:tetratricopeptide (TPR) repeat protein